MPRTGNLKDAVSRLGLPALTPYLRETPGFRVAVRGVATSWEPVQDTWRLPGAGLVAKVKTELVTSHRVAVQSVTLVNESHTPSPPINILDVLHLPLAVHTRHAPRAWIFGTGLAESTYPPRGFQETEVCFGRACPQDPQSKQWSRWWVGKRWFTLGQGHGTYDSNHYIPLMQVAWQSEAGEVGLWAALEWSGHYELQFGTSEDWQFLFRGGPTVNGMILDPGETLQLPPVHIGVWSGTPEDGHNSIRRYVIDVLSPNVDGRRPWPYIAYHHWYGIYEKITDQLIRAQADVAARIGMEYFELDAGWFVLPGEKYYSGIGNWESVDKTKFPHGLEPVAEYVRSKGMRFGMWFEPERARKGTDIALAHPDWFWGQGASLCANLTRRDVQDGLIELLSGWMKRLNVRWLRWDGAFLPQDYWDEVDPTGKVQFRYLEGLYRVIDTLLERFPGLLFDNCGAMCRRRDFAALKRTGTGMYDQPEDPHIARRMQTGGARILPPYITHLSAPVSPGDGDALTSFDILSRLAGTFSLSGMISQWSDRQVAMVKGIYDAFRTYRHVLSGNFYRLSPIPRTADDWDVVEFIDFVCGEAAILAFRMRGDTDTLTVHPTRLDPDTTYRVIDPYAQTTLATLTGAELAGGLSFTLPRDGAAVRHLIPVSGPVNAK